MKKTIDGVRIGQVLCGIRPLQIAIITPSLEFLEGFGWLSLVLLSTMAGLQIGAVADMKGRYK